MKKTLFYSLILLLLISLCSCQRSFRNSTYKTQSGLLYLKFIDGNTVEWKRNYSFQPEECEYKIEEDKVRVVRKSLKLVTYFTIIDDKILEQGNGNRYYLK